MFGELTGAIRTEIPGPRSRVLAGRLKEVEGRGVTYVADDFPVFWKRARGSNVEDVDGNIYVDLTSAFGVASAGHANASIVAAVRNQLDLLPHAMGDVHPAEIKVELLEALSKLVPLTSPKTILCSAGAEAVEAALKTAHLRTGKPGVIYFSGGYHGLSYGTLAVAGRLEFREPFADQIGSFGYPASYPKASDADATIASRSLDEIEKIIAEHRHTSAAVGAVVVEPIQGRGGIVIPPKGWLADLRKLTQQHHVLLIADEIMTGFGRTGRWFGVEHENVVPDLLCVGKAFTGTLPFSACIGSADIMEAWPASTGEALHTSTFLGNPLGCAAALAMIRETEKRELPFRSETLGKSALDRLRASLGSVLAIRDIRGRGLMIGIELASTGQRSVAFELSKRLLRRGLVTLPADADGNVLSLLPPLTISEEQLNWALSLLEDELKQLT